MTREEIIKGLYCGYQCTEKDECFESGCRDCIDLMFAEYEKQIKAEVIDEVKRAMYHQCFECDNDEDMQKWDSGNWFRYKLFENVIEQLNTNIKTR